MPRLPRNIHKIGFFHIMVQGINKSYIFRTEAQKKEYIKLMKECNKKFDIKVISYCIMDNHSHMIIYSEHVTNISNYMKSHNTSYGIYYNKTNDRIGFVFRNRFQSQYIDDENYLINCIKYIHMNSVKAGKELKEEDYKYSSYKEYFKNKKIIINKEPLIKIFVNEKDILERIKTANDEIEVMDIERDEENFKIAMQEYLKENKLNLEEIKNNKNNIKDVAKYLKKKKYKQVQLAKMLDINPKTLSRMLK